MTGQYLKWRIFAVLLVIVFGILTLLPNFTTLPQGWWLSKDKLKYGLDIQGGLHLVLGVDVRGVLQEKLERYGESLKQELSKDSKEPISITAAKVEPSGASDHLVLTFPDKASVEKGWTSLSKKYYFFQEVSRTDTTLTVKYSDLYVNEMKKNTLDQAIETIRNRIDEFGVSEPSITAQGEDRILVQLPGLKEAERAKELINRTARLEFMIVSEKMKPDELAKMIDETEKAGNYSLKDMKYSAYVKRVNEDLKAKLPDHTKVLFEKAPNTDKMELGKIPLLLETTTGLGGESVKDAFVAQGEFGEPEVSMNFNPEGANKFAEITGNNVNRQMAIVLDDVVYSAPNIKGKIAGGSARITLGGARDFNAIQGEAKIISMALRAGALPAKLEQLEERTIGPSLGADAIKKGQRAAIIGGLLVVLFMLVWYKAFGVIADLAILINVTLIYAILSALEATLTLPGLAGIALTVGMAVDANVIINERIKDELRLGGSMTTAIREGYRKAFSAVFDANIMTAATSFVLMYFGTGPVRGFAVTLLIGICTTMFANVFVTHVILDFLFGKVKLKKIAI